IDLLKVISPVYSEIIDSAIPHVLALGDRFQMQKVLKTIESHLIPSNQFSIAEKLRLSDQYRLDK
ncbi:hypothetical protein PMAYCL1PPCAC_25500, partial [Pristionchus mayeri]